MHEEPAIRPVSSVGSVEQVLDELAHVPTLTVPHAPSTRLSAHRDTRPGYSDHWDVHPHLVLTSPQTRQ